MKKNLLKILTLVFYFLFFTNTKAQNISTSVGNGFPGYTGDGGLANFAQLANPYGITFGPGDTLYIMDQANSAIRKVTPTGTITTVCGSGVFGFTGDGGPANLAQLNNPNAIAVDSAGNIYITDTQNSRIRKINTAGIINTIAGTGVAGYSGDGAAATLAKISNSTSGIACDTSGNIYFADRGNNCIRKINPLGIISTVAGTGTAGYSGDGSAATLAKLTQPVGIMVNLKDSSLYISDNGNHVIRRVNKTGTISTVVGTGVTGSTGDGGFATAATLNGPAAVTFDATGQMFISDFNAHVVRKVDVSGMISSAAGTGFAAFGGDGGLATAAFLNRPCGLGFNAAGDLFISDYVNNRIRKVKYNITGVNQLAAGNAQVNVYPNPSSGIFNLTLGNFSRKLTLEVFTVSGKKISVQILESNTTQINLSNLSNGVYELHLLNEEHAIIYQNRIVKQ